MTKVFIVGAGGFGRELYSWLSLCQESKVEVVGFLDDNPAAHESLLKLGISAAVYPLEQVPSELRDAAFLLGFANCAHKPRAIELLQAQGLSPFSYVHPAARIGLHNRIGAGTAILLDCVITTNVTVGQHVLLNSGTKIGHDVEIGDFTTSFGFNALNGNVRIGRGVTIGSGATIHPGVEVGDGATIGIGSVVIKNVPAGQTVFGNPAKRLVS
jgi:sugar O-acyltransferase (sialic acid O-acetyltransferase NeuD family)